MSKCCDHRSEIWTALLRGQSEDSYSLQADAYLDSAPSCVKACGPIVGTSDFAINIGCWIRTEQTGIFWLAIAMNCEDCHFKFRNQSGVVSGEVSGHNWSKS